MQSVHRGDDLIDLCADHGVWLDKDELERMCARRARRAQRRIRSLERASQTDRLLWWLPV